MKVKKHSVLGLPPERLLLLYLSLSLLVVNLSVLSLCSRSRAAATTRSAHSARTSFFVLFGYTRRVIVDFWFILPIGSIWGVFRSRGNRCREKKTELLPAPFFTLTFSHLKNRTNQRERLENDWFWIRRRSKIMSSSSPSMSVMEMEESSDTSREDRKSRRHRPSAAQPKGRQITRNFAHPPPVSIHRLFYIWLFLFHHRPLMRSLIVTIARIRQRNE